MNKKIYDTIIIGGGPAGYTAALYAVRAGLSALIIEKYAAGGQMTQTNIIDNYPGFEEGIDGYTLGSKMQKCASRFGAESVQGEVVYVNLNGAVKTVGLAKGEYQAKTIIIATGAEHRKLNLLHEDELVGRGVSYCATCDGMLFRGKTVAVVGGGNTAAGDALTLARVCKEVYLIHRRGELRASKIYVEQLKNTGNVSLILNANVKELLFGNKLSGAILNVDGGEKTLQLDGLFISVGRAPATKLFEGIVDMDGSGYIIADETTQTSVSGVYAIGDVRTKPVRQIVTATADGATAIHFVEEYLNK
jgi:thioredoxin reductase (NADPH)